MITNNALPHTMEFNGIDDKHYKITVDYGTFSSSTGHTIYIKIIDDAGNSKPVKIGCPKRLASLLSYYNPTDITITADGHSVNWNYEKTMAALWKEHKCHQLKHEDDNDCDCWFNHELESYHLHVAAVFIIGVEYWIDTKETRAPS